MEPTCHNFGCRLGCLLGSGFSMRLGGSLGGAWRRVWPEVRPWQFASGTSQLRFNFPRKTFAKPQT